MPNNYQRLKDEADIATVVEHLQIPVTKRGSAYFIPCPNPGHEDTHATNCYFKDGWNNVYCCVCGKSMQAIDLIMAVTGYDYGEAADYLWELEGRPSWYYTKHRKRRKPSFSLTREEAELIGIHPTGKALIPKRLMDQKECLAKGREFYQKDVSGYLECTVSRIRWQDLLTEKQYRILAMNKCLETKRRLKDNIIFFWSLDQACRKLGVQDRHTLLLLTVCQFQLKRCEALYKRIKTA